MVKAETDFGPIYMINMIDLWNLDKRTPYFIDKINNNMEKKYRLIKEPIIPGKIWERNVREFLELKEGLTYTIGQWTKIFPWLIGEQIANMPEWFELVEEKEFTRSDMRKFAKWFESKNRDYISPYMDEYINEWFKQNKP